MRAIGRIIAFTRHLTPFYVGIVVCSLLASAAALTTPFITGAATNLIVDGLAAGAGAGAGTGDGAAAGAGDVVTGVLWLMVLFVAIELFAIGVRYAGGFLGDVMSERMRASLSTRYFEHLLRLPQRYFDDELTGTIVSRLDRSIVTITTFAQMFANNFLSTLVTTFAILVITALYAWPIALLLLVVIPVYVWLTALTSTRWQRYEAAKNEHVDAARGRFTEVVGQIRVVASFAQEAREARHFREHFGEVVRVTTRQSRWWHSMDTLRNVVLALVFGSVLVIVFTMAARGELTIGDMVVLVQLLIMTRQPILMMSMFIDTSQRAIAGSVDYFTVMSVAPDPVSERDARRRDAGEAPRPIEPVAGAPAIEFDDVSFAYEGGRDALDGVSFTVQAGERVALVSESGGGKTTIIQLLLGFYRPRTGEIRVIGRPIDELSRDELRRAVGVVFQEAQLFSGTVRENIAYAEPDASDASIETAARRANAHEFVAGFADGYDTVIGERGLKLSGGQRQRIAVARAALKDAPLLVLDEATSALDTKSERLVQEGLDELMQGRSSLIVAHRLSTIASVDRIVTLRGGRVDEIGAPAELAASGGLYGELLALQESGRKTDRQRLRALGIRA